jgi:hypothetical protein
MTAFPDIMVCPWPCRLPSQHKLPRPFQHPTTPVRRELRFLSPCDINLGHILRPGPHVRQYVLVIATRLAPNHFWRDEERATTVEGYTERIGLAIGRGLCFTCAWDYA